MSIYEISNTAPAVRAEPKLRVVGAEERVRQNAAESRLRRGKTMVIAGFVITVIGILAYCAVCMSAAVGGVSPDDAPSLSIIAAMGIMAAGTLSWLAGSIQYMIGAMDSDSEEEISF